MHYVQHKVEVMLYIRLKYWFKQCSSNTRYGFSALKIVPSVLPGPENEKEPRFQNFGAKKEPYVLSKKCHKYAKSGS